MMTTTVTIQSALHWPTKQLSHGIVPSLDFIITNPMDDRDDEPANPDGNDFGDEQFIVLEDKEQANPNGNDFGDNQFTLVDDDEPGAIQHDNGTSNGDG